MRSLCVRAAGKLSVEPSVELSVKPSVKPSVELSVELNRQPPSIIDRVEFVSADATNEISKALGCHGSGLLDEHLRRLGADCDRGAEDSWLR